MAPRAPQLAQASSQVSTRRRRRFVLPVVALCAGGLAAFGRGLPSFGAAFATAGTVRERPSGIRSAADDGKKAANRDAERRDASSERGRRQSFGDGAEDFESASLSANVSQAGSMGVDGVAMAQGPPWATCFVEQIMGGRHVLEEWTLRGDSQNLDAFRAWSRRGTAGAAGGAAAATGPSRTRCTSGGQVDLATMCLQCVAQAAPAAPAAGAAGSATSTVATRVLSTDVDLQHCMSKTIGATAFCKSGQVLVPS